jgi:hypothetical protein
MQTRQKEALGEPQNEATFKKVMDETRKQFRIGSYAMQPASPEVKARYLGAPRSGGVPRETDTVTSIKPNKDMKRMANAAYGHIKDEGKRLQQWAKDVGWDVVREMAGK